MTRNKKITNAKLTGKGKDTVKVGNHLHTNVKSNSNCERRRVQRQDTGNAFEIKRPALCSLWQHIY